MKHAVDYDIIVVGGGPAGLSAAVRAAWLAAPAADYKASILLMGLEQTLHEITIDRLHVAGIPSFTASRSE